MGWGEKVLPLVAEIMSDSGVILIECAAKDTMPAAAGSFAKYREYRYGKTKIVQYRRPLNGGETADEN
jgi:16S rRNA G966 N2-methylase RsmD